MTITRTRRTRALSHTVAAIAALLAALALPGRAPAVALGAHMVGEAWLGSETDTVHITLSLPCDGTRKAQGLQVESSDGLRFTLDRILNVECSYDATPPEEGTGGSQQGTGTGRCNGSPATVSWTFEDSGEDSTRPDTASVAIRGIDGICGQSWTDAALLKGQIRMGRCYPSFSLDTAILLPDGGTAPIRDLDVGDVVATLDHGVPTSGRIVDVIRHTYPVTVGIATDAGVIQATPHHPFFVPGQGWVPAINLAVGTGLQTAHGATIVRAVRWERNSQLVENLTVEPGHVFFVGQVQALVHNC